MSCFYFCIYRPFEGQNFQAAFQEVIAPVGSFIPLNVPNFILSFLYITKMLALPPETKIALFYKKLVKKPEKRLLAKADTC